MEEMLADDQNEGLDAIPELVGFATTALEVRAMSSGRDPFPCCRE
jgi:hypothetical protein